MNVLVTGASSGMGFATISHLSQQGYKVYAGTRDPKKLESVSTESIIPIYLDITDPNNIMSNRDLLQNIDVLINNAGYGLVSTIEEMDESQMFAQFDVNLFGAMRMTQAVIPGMRERQSGVIINISSFLGKVGLPLLTLYNASKYALEGVTDSLRQELYPFGIRVHSILPGFFDTEFAKSNLIVNKRTMSEDSPYKGMADALAPTIINEINSGNDPVEVAKIIQKIIENDNYPARVTAGDKSAKFIPMRRELSDEDFEMRVREYYGIEE